jgi:hypothetical protein
LQSALKRPNVPAHMQEMIMRSLGVSAMKAARRMDELMTCDNAQTCFNAAALRSGWA